VTRRNPGRSRQARTICFHGVSGARPDLAIHQIGAEASDVCVTPAG
jgi:hypothetical protein